MATALTIPAIVPTSAVVSENEHTHTLRAHIAQSKICQTDIMISCTSAARQTEPTVVVIILVDAVIVAALTPIWRHTQ